MALPLLGALARSPASSGYQIGNSLRARSSSSGSLSRTPGAASNRKTWTISFWVKRSRTAVYETIFAAPNGTADATWQQIAMNNDALVIGGYATNYRITTALLRDPSAWYHVVVAQDTTQATGQNRIRVYVNGSEVTSFSTNNHPALNADLGINNAVAHTLGGAVGGSGANFEGLFAEVNFVDGQQLTSSSFGQNDATTGEWVAKKYAGTFGTNGFYLNFSDTSAATAAAIGKDSSGNGNNWTPSGISVANDYTRDALLDTPTNNCIVLNPLRKDSGITLSDGNTRMTLNSTAAGYAVNGSIALPTSGKWYFEITNIVANPYLVEVGLLDAANVTSSNSASVALYGAMYSQYGPYDKVSFSNGSEAYNANGPVWSGMSSPSAAGDVLMIAYDADNGKLWMGKNGTWWNTSGTANPATGADPHWSSLPSRPYIPWIDGYNTTYPDLACNFGQRAFAYTPPSGFKAPNTANFPAATIKNPGAQFKAKTYTGSGAIQAITGVGFQPDLVWIKRRDSAAGHNLFDSVRGARIHLSSELTNAEYGEGAGVSLTSFDADGFSLGTDNVGAGQVNANGGAFAAWCWKKGATPGFDVVAVASASAAAVNHSCGAKPALIIAKNRGTGGGWQVTHKSLGANMQDNLLGLSSTSGNTLSAGLWGGEPTSTQFFAGNGVITTGGSYISYLWAEIAGFSKFGSYQGNGSSDGPFVYCGFRPAFVLVKRTDAVGSWYMLDATRGTFNPIDELGSGDALLAESSVSESSVLCPATDFTSSGFKIRDTIADFNGAGNSFIFAAFAEMPVQAPANAR